MFPKDWLTTMDSMHREMERLLNDFSRRKPPSGQFSPLSWVPAIDIYESPDRFTVLVELCGVRREDIELVVDGHNLIIRGYRKHPSPEAGGSCQQLEIYWGPFERQVALASPVDPEATQAAVADGILEIVLPKAHRDFVRQVPIVRAGRP